MDQIQQFLTSSPGIYAMPAIILVLLILLIKKSLEGFKVEKFTLQDLNPMNENNIVSQYFRREKS